LAGSNEQGGTVALPDWEHVALNGRTVYLAFDSDVVTKSAVHAALLRLRDLLRRRDAQVMVIHLPSGTDGEKVGLDDSLAAGHDRVSCFGSLSPTCRGRSSGASAISPVPG
jgi:hypothetical protein